ncbi:MAG: hypothetical protein KME64_19285 [Scytonematopsis contorta HA4267-MV1]|nr:hypothetical protein [Scytonematopsis contorta HA4267-MV1]
MNRLNNFLKKILPQQVLAAFLAGLLSLSTLYSTAGINIVAINKNLAQQQLIATSDRQSELLYPGAETPAGRIQKEREMPIISEKDFQPKPGSEIQREPDVGTRVKERIETVKENFGEASAFLKDKGQEASQRPELKPNPTKHR